METKYRSIDISSWVKVGEGGNGSTYEDLGQPDILLKLNKKRLSGLETVKTEFDTSVAVARLGLSTPRMIEIVKVGDSYATIIERVRQKKSMSSICHDYPERIDEMGRLLCSQLKILESTPCDTSIFLDHRQLALQAIQQAVYIPRNERDFMFSLISKVPEVTTCSHGDFQTGNIIIAQNRCYWIDLGRFGYGHPIFDISHLYLICNVYSKIGRARNLFHMTREQLLQLWDSFAVAYSGNESHADFDDYVKQHAAADILLRTAYDKPTFLERLFFKAQIHSVLKPFV